MTVLLTAALRTTVIVGAAWIATQALGAASADIRRRIWLATLWAIALLPIVLWFAARDVSPALRIEMPPSMTGWSAQSARQAVPWLAVGWIAGVLIVLGRLTAGLVAVQRLTRAAQRAHDGLVAAGQDVRYADDLMTPVTWGMLHPVVLLPGYMRSWADDRRLLLIQHEQAHIAQHDWLWQMVAQGVCAAFWFHPLVWLAASRLARESEQAADDRVLASGADAPGYAAELVAIARMVHAARWPAAIAVIGRSPLEHRVRNILDRTCTRHAATRTARVVVVTAMALAVVALSVPLAAQQTAHVYRIGDPGITPPVDVFKPKPYYTQEAMRKRIEGSVLLRTIVTEQGLADQITIVQSLDDGLDAEAVEALLGWRFTPGEKDGTPVPVEIHVEVEFALR